MRVVPHPGLHRGSPCALGPVVSSVHGGAPSAFQVAPAATAAWAGAWADEPSASEETGCQTTRGRSAAEPIVRLLQLKDQMTAGAGRRGLGGDTP